MAAPDLRSARWRKSSYSGGNGGDCVEVAFEDVTWHKSSYSGGNGGNCVEVAFANATWHKSSHSNGNGGNCVEVAHTPELAAVRDSKNPTGPALVFTRTALAGFLRAL